MIKFDLTAIFYSKKNYDMEHRLQRTCQSYSISLVSAIDFVELAIKCTSLKPSIVFCDCSTINLSSNNLTAFIEKEEFKNTKIIFVGNQADTKAYHSFTSENIIIASLTEVPALIDEMQSKMRFDKLNTPDENFSSDQINISIYKLLCSIGLSSKHSGCAYLRECIKNVILNNGVIHSLVSDQYPYVASVFKTSAVNVERNIRNAIDRAWTTYGKDNWYKVFFSKSMQMGKKPTNRELIDMCSQIIQSEIKYNITPNYETL